MKTLLMSYLLATAKQRAPGYYVIECDYKTILQGSVPGEEDWKGRGTLVKTILKKGSGRPTLKS